MTKAVAVRFLRRHSLGTIPRARAAVVARAFGCTLTQLGPLFQRSGPVAVPELACALAGIDVEIPAHLAHLISQWNTERATLNLAPRYMLTETAASSAPLDVPRGC